MNTVKPDQALSRRQEIHGIGVDFIRPSQHRRAINQDAVDVLAGSFDKIGLQTPITVRSINYDPDSAGEDIELISGHHRLAAAKQLGWETIECVIIDDLNDTDARLLEIAENLHRADLTVQERSDQIAEWTRLCKERKDAQPAQPGGSQPQEKGQSAAAKELSISRRDVQRAEKIAALPSAVKEAAKEAGFENNQTALLEAAELETPEAQIEYLKNRSGPPSRLPTPSQAREIARSTKRMVAASDGYIYSGATEEEGQDYIRRREQTYGVIDAVNTLVDCPVDAAAWIEQAETHQLHKFQPSSIDNAIEFLSVLRDALNEKKGVTDLEVAT